jgi:hypothetical protein
MTRGEWVAILLVLSVAGAACGRGDEKGSERVGAPSSTAATPVAHKEPYAFEWPWTGFGAVALFSAGDAPAWRSTRGREC